MEQLDNNPEIKIIQVIVLDLYKKFAEICEENNLIHYFTGGSLIGVKRHNGFIPWDDDIDIVMPRRDFDKFQKIASELASEEYGICNRWTDKNWHFAFAQFIDRKFEIEINITDEPRKTGVWIDIFPIDGVPNGKLKRKLFVYYILLQRYIIQSVYIKTQSDSIRKRPFYEKTIITILKRLPMEKIVDADQVVNRMEDTLRKYDMYQCEYSGNLLGKQREREIVPTRFWGTPQKERFEDEIVLTPQNGDGILRLLYGDYMKIPPKEDRETHRIRILKIK